MLSDKFLKNEEIQELSKKCITKNEEILQFAKIIVSNYHSDNLKMYNAMNKYTDLNIYKPIDENINTIINYFT